MKKFDYYQPQSLKEAYGLMEKQKGNAAYIAGGTDLIVQMKQGAVQPKALISLRGVEELNGVRCNQTIAIGSMTPFRDLERASDIAQQFPALTQAVSVLANPQVRNVATIGGNLCNSAPSADCAPPLLVLDAKFTLAGPGGEREIAVEEFFKGPGENRMDSVEILTRVTIPKKASNEGMAFLKVGRSAQDIAIANVAALIAIDNKTCSKCRLAAGAVAPVPMRLKDVERVIEGEEITPELMEQVANMVENEVSPITDVRSTEEYRRTVTGVMAKRAILQAAGSLERIPS